jgi:hypothetical protein
MSRPISGWALDYTAGTFSRTAEASYQTGAPTDGTSPFLAWAATGVAVNENMGDGAGALLRIEGARTNRVLSCRDSSNATYWAVDTGAAIKTPNQGPSPDGGNHSTEINCSGAQYARAQGGLNQGSPETISAWMIAKSGTPTPKAFWSGFNAFTVTLNTSTWKRDGATNAGVSRATLYAIDQLDFGGGAIDCLQDLYQDEGGRFPSSAIRTTTATVTRDADVLTFTSGQLDATFFTKKAKFLQVSPEFANTDLVNGDTNVLLACNAGNDGIVIEKNAGVTVVSAFQGGARKASSGTLTFARNALLGVVQWDPVAAVITVNGVSGAAGTPWSWTPSTTRLGGIPSGASEAFCRFGVLQSA